MPKTKTETTPTPALTDRPTPEAASPPAKCEYCDCPPGVHLVSCPRIPANIKFIGRVEYDKAKRKILKRNDPIDRFSDAGEMFYLPPADFQIRRRLFYHESAARIAATFPNLYKLVRSK